MYCTPRERRLKLRTMTWFGVASEAMRIMVQVGFVLRDILVLILIVWRLYQ